MKMAKKTKIYTMAPYIKSVLKFLAERQNRFFEGADKGEKDSAFGTTVKRIGSIQEEINKRLRPKEPFQPKSLERIFQHLKREGFLKPAKGKKEEFVTAAKAYKFLGIEKRVPGKKVLSKGPLKPSGGKPVKPSGGKPVKPPAKGPLKLPAVDLVGDTGEAVKKEVTPGKVVREYQPREIYEKGDIIHHKVWEEEGEVVEKRETANWHKVIVVSFPRAGRKKLITGHSALRI
jgi:hypothetical protein